MSFSRLGAAMALLSWGANAQYQTANQCQVAPNNPLLIGSPEGTPCDSNGHNDDYGYTCEAAFNTLSSVSQPVVCDFHASGRGNVNFIFKKDILGDEQPCNVSLRYVDRNQRPSYPGIQVCIGVDNYDDEHGYKRCNGGDVSPELRLQVFPNCTVGVFNLERESFGYLTPRESVINPTVGFSGFDFNVSGRCDYDIGQLNIKELSCSVDGPIIESSTLTTSDSSTGTTTKTTTVKSTTPSTSPTSSPTTRTKTTSVTTSKSSTGTTTVSSTVITSDSSTGTTTKTTTDHRTGKTTVTTTSTYFGRVQEDEVNLNYLALLVLLPVLLCIKQGIDSSQDSNRVGVESEFFNISALPGPGSLQERLVLNPVYAIPQAWSGEAGFADAVAADLTGLGSSAGETAV